MLNSHGRNDISKDKTDDFVLGLSVFNNVLENGNG